MRRPLQQTRLAPQLPRFQPGQWQLPPMTAPLEVKESRLKIPTAMKAVAHLLPDEVEEAPVVFGVADHAMGASVGGLAARRCLPIVYLPEASLGEERSALER